MTELSKMKSELRILKGLIHEDGNYEKLYWRVMNRMAFLTAEIKKIEKKW